MPEETKTVTFIGAPNEVWPGKAIVYSSYDIETTKAAARDSLNRHFIWAVRFEIRDSKGNLIDA